MRIRHDNKEDLAIQLGDHLFPMQTIQSKIIEIPVRNTLLNIFVFFQCQCKGAPDYKLVTGFGCAQGGTPWCAHEKDLVCPSGKIVNLGMAIDARLQAK